MVHNGLTGEQQGLSSQEAAARLKRYGPNALPAEPPQPTWRRFLRQFKSPLIYILLFALALDLFFWVRESSDGFPFEAVAIGLILLLNAGLGVWQERKAEAALARLKQLAAPQVWVWRDGEWKEHPAHELVPGDLVRLEAGGRIPADGLAILAEGCLVDESMLSGESLPVEKNQGDELFSGTLLVRGRALLEVTRTGRESALGKLATLLGQIEAEKTPLERRLEVFGNRVARWVLLLAAVLVVAGVLVEGPSRIGEVLVFAVALAVAAVPEGLPAVLTFTLALGVERMAKRKAVVRKLSAVEALGSVTVIATDKTGTLTENQMHVRHLDSPEPERALRAMVLANDAEVNSSGDEEVGDPLEVALLRYAQTQGQDPWALRAACPRISSHPFDSAWKYMRVTVEEEGKPISYFKGAPEVLLPKTRLEREEQGIWLEKALAYASEGYRVLGLAWAEGEREEGLEFAGLVLFWDPPRPEVPEAIRKAQEAGIRVLMVTGDHPATALAIARQIGIPSERVLTGEDLQNYDPQALEASLREVNVFARVHPEQKLRLVEVLQAQGEIVAMTGDGVNDAPALKRSDVGVAMGQRGSDVSREVADLVLLDDNFATIVAAIEEGRSIYENIQKFIRFLFSTNLSEVLVVAVGALLAFLLDLHDVSGGLLLPLTAVQILWINLVTDSFPALSLAFDRNPGVMQRPPRPPSSPLMDKPSLRFVFSSGTIKALLALGLLGLVPGLKFGLVDAVPALAETARSVVFHFLAIAQLFFVYPARHTQLHPLPNPILHAAVLLGILIQILVGSIPAVASALGAVLLPLPLWGLILGVSLLAWGFAELVNRISWR
ncbi:ATPase, P-type (transporting), HAD superfamily, subfamily IC [Allomeiothermus silvanus DSM 9946]|uniref:ATPase, P-type (Transporting), HAD superfamily, subfamily IC n=1 Tax=Allomeiothermus silvanus (strain ATCC 700542 / DSM 9946 / NBRC 106475 / NCIMB 13440 / VI-R2) TaxID=526227 RepID=D7BEQ2_ALLS1|nr:cation-translocating P-type ATPase [Allomeiothermus silvanus]ADH64998.1 ATPase, P-type (transporting), HAD superfamily, subfamily IC [Allomeiothermus silvanus DSM 9946]